MVSMIDDSVVGRFGSRPSKKVVCVTAPSKPAVAAGGGKSPSGFVRPAPRHAKGNMTRSSSVGVLNNQSDSESDPQPSSRTNAPTNSGAPSRGAGQGLMRPTISSMNKAAAASARRRGLPASYSTELFFDDLYAATCALTRCTKARARVLHTASLAAAGQEESSSEAEGVADKPAVPPRPRAGSVDHSAQRRIGRSGSERDLSAKAREVTTRLTAGTRARAHEAAKADQPHADPQSKFTDNFHRILPIRCCREFAWP
ncbi:hypothetical protein EVAR_78920_1 [Eumeta japonica]|uniref:Uncharacterized protein n=1 Tax=Eumeta variegata TaxID=151549 RepID=A0A4C1U2J9_EUMVA|nr:hypothetical protein EVAR_78920_1 [Eumeta japonica]